MFVFVRLLGLEGTGAQDVGFILEAGLKDMGFRWLPGRTFHFRGRPKGYGVQMASW